MFNTSSVQNLRTSIQSTKHENDALVNEKKNKILQFQQQKINGLQTKIESIKTGLQQISTSIGADLKYRLESRLNTLKRKAHDLEEVGGGTIMVRQEEISNEHPVKRSKLRSSRSRLKSRSSRSRSRSRDHRLTDSEEETVD